MTRITRKNDYIKDKLYDFKNPIILEFGVNKGGSTKLFLDYVENYPIIVIIISFFLFLLFVLIRSFLH